MAAHCPSARNLRAAVVPLLLALLCGCGGRAAPPSSGPADPDAAEIALGERHFAQARQSQGGDLATDPALTAYVRDVGARLAASADRGLPYEFAILDDTVPHAWALPGGKVAVSRGLLTALRSEAELAAVLAREIVHAAARPDAPGVGRGGALQGTAVAVGLVPPGTRYARLAVLEGRDAVRLASVRPAATEATDVATLQLMKRTGYDARAAIDVQGSLLARSRAPGSAGEGLFATQPPSEARLAAIRRVAADVGAGGDTGAQRFLDRTTGLRAATTALEALAEGRRALARGDLATAGAAARRALAAGPREARAHELMGDVALANRRPEAALEHYAEALRLQPDYFKPHVQTGIALHLSGRLNEAEPALRRSLQLLPTAPAHHLLGMIAEGAGRIDEALRHYEAAAGAASEFGRQASARFVRLDLPRNPRRYLQADVHAATDGTLYAVLQNAAPVPLLDLRVRIGRVDGDRFVDQTPPFTVPQPLQAGRSLQIPMVRVNLRSPDDAQFFRVLVESVRAMPQG